MIHNLNFSSSEIFISKQIVIQENEMTSYDDEMSKGWVLELCDKVRFVFQNLNLKLIIIFVFKRSIIYVWYIWHAVLVELF